MWGGGEGGGGGGGGGADGVCSERVCSCGLTHMQLIKKRAGASALVPSAGLTSWNPSTPVPCEGRFQASPVQTSPNPEWRKRLRSPPTSPPSPTEEEERGAIFSISSALDAVDPEYHEKMHLEESSWLARPFYQRLPPPFPTLGKDQGRKRVVKIVVQCRSFSVPSKSSAAAPLGHPTPRIQP